jgi:hypothetical protein
MEGRVSSEVLAPPVNEARLTSIATEVLAIAVSEARVSAITAAGAAVGHGERRRKHGTIVMMLSRTWIPSCFLCIAFR